jgi:hypothetical protein
MKRSILIIGPPLIEVPPASRRSFLTGGLAALVGLCPTLVLAGPFDSIPLSRESKVLREGSLVVPAQQASTPGVAGADISSPARGWLDVTYAVETRADITLLILTQRQKTQLSNGQQLEGDPLARVPIRGPETATHSTTLNEGGSYFLAFVNRATTGVNVAYRIAIKAF